MGIAITNSPPKEIQLSIKDQGWNLLDYSRSRITPLTIDLGRKYYQKGEILITSDQLIGRINRYKHFMHTTTLLEVHPDSILIQYQKLTKKNLPVELVSDIELARQYILSDKIRIEPARITVFGPKQILDTLKAVRTEVLKINNLSDTIHLHCKLKQVKLLRYSTPNCKVSIFVEPFTERKVQIPVVAINCPPRLSIRTFPAFVNVVYTVGLSHFNVLDENDIQIFLDYNDLKSNKLSKQKLIINNNSTHISNIRISPEEVEFILEQK
jgi:YbbR domain-containing protein